MKVTEGSKKSNGWLLWLGLGLAGAYALQQVQSAINYRRVLPLGAVSRELEASDTNPKDNVLSRPESDEFFKRVIDKDKDGFINKFEVDDALQVVERLKDAYHKNTKESADNLATSLDIVLIRQTLKDTGGISQYPQYRPKELSYGDFINIAFKEETPLLRKVQFTNGMGQLLAVFKDGSENFVRIPKNEGIIRDLANRLAENSIEVQFDENNQEAINFLIYMIIPAVLLMGGLYFIMRNVGGRFSFMTSMGKKLQQKMPAVTFDDVAGCDEVKEQVREVVEFLKNPEQFNRLGGRMPRGVLLIGPPGTGKTLLARAVAGEAGVPFYSLSGSDFVEMFVGMGAARVRDLFKQAKEHSPAIVFIDEIDAVGRSRGTGLGGGNDEREQTLNAILVEMDGFNKDTAVIVLAATNRPDVLDSALLRPGRFDRRAVFDRPDVKGREAILKVHAKGKLLDNDVDLKIIAQRTTLFTGADLENLLNEAALLAGSRGKEAISMSDVEDAVDTIINGGPERRSRVMSLHDKIITAYHEAGHAVVAALEDKKHLDSLHKVTIIPRGMSLGSTTMRPEQDHWNYSKSQLLAQIRVLLGGRIAEELVLHDSTTGAESDLKRATKIVGDMVRKFAMSDKLPTRTFGVEHDEVFFGRDFGQERRDFSEATAQLIDEEIERIIDGLEQEVEGRLNEKRKYLEALAQVLLVKETVDAGEVREIFSQVDTGTFKVDRSVFEEEGENL